SDGGDPDEGRIAVAGERGPGLAAVGGPVNPAGVVGPVRTPGLVNTGKPRVLIGVERVDHQVLGPALHVGNRAVGPGCAAIGADKDAGAVREGAGRVAAARVGAGQRV